MTLEDKSFDFPDKETFICDECGEMRYVDDGCTTLSDGVVCSCCRPILYDPVSEEEKEAVVEKEEGKGSDKSDAEEESFELSSQN